MYVEWDEGRRWGWYEGEGLLLLVQWLREGCGAEREQPLLRALATCPMGPVGLTSAQLQRLRPDAYCVGGADGTPPVAPLLRGEGGRYVPLGTRCLAPTIAQRIEGCCEALLGDVDFWFEGEVPASSVSGSGSSSLLPSGAMLRATRAMEAFRVG